MKKRIPATEVRQRLNVLLDDVRLRGAEYFIERNGESAVIVVSVEVYARFQQARAEAFDRIEALCDRLSRDVSADDLKGLVDEAAAEVKALRRL